MITLYYLENSQSIRIMWLLEELGLPYQVEYFARDPETMLAPQEYKHISPTGTAPCIRDGEVVISESAAIMDYLLDLDNSDRLRPLPGREQRVNYLFWSHFSQGSLQPLMTSKLLFDKMAEKAPIFISPILSAVFNKAKSVFLTPRLNTYYQLMENHLQQYPWFAGDVFTAADIAMYYPVATAKVRAGLDHRYPRVMDFLTRMEQRSAYKTVIQKSGGFRPLS